MTKLWVVSVAVGLCMLTGCQKPGVPAAPARADLSAELIRRNEPGPPSTEEGVCWAQDVTPAIIETVTEQVVVEPATYDADGKVLTQAIFRTDVQQHMVKDREEVWFRTPCPDALTLEFIATLQRALKARGLYLQPLTGEMDDTTRGAIRRFQEPLGLDSPILSLGAARDLGIANADLGLE